ncbi:SLATT domain-containing protein [Shewanella sp. 38A_GOM-205m]|uniref:SLATT domain-containing protein n=1 Tax=Shewanella sp. 38A_GOM-205m TaxID=1380363 RepID=UPI00048B0860|nr:SLATT domain-containing protein [Shewanella sp. 38A_GOM-205m]
MTRSNKENLRVKSKNTAYARFFAARRYKMLNSLSLFSLTASSFSLIFITLVDKYSNSKIFVENTIDLLLVISAIIISALSLAIALSNYSEKSIKMLKSGEELNELVRKIEHLSDDEYYEQKEALNKEYTTLIKNSENHQDFEFHYGKKERKREERISSETTTTNIADLMRFRLKRYTTPSAFCSISLIYISFTLLTLVLFIKENDILIEKQPIKECTANTDKGKVEKNVEPDI